MMLPLNAITKTNAAMARLADRGGYLTRHNRWYVVGTLACIGGGLLSIMFFNTALIFLGCGVIAALLDVRRRQANDSAQWLRQQRRALEDCVNASNLVMWQPRCRAVGCAAERVCELRTLITDWP